MMKKRIFAAIMASIALLCCSAALAQEQRVYDYAELFSPGEAQEMEAYIAELRAGTGYDFAVLTAAEGVYDTVAYADDFYDSMGFGAGDNHSGILFFVDMQNRTSHISTCGDLIDIVDDQREEAIFDEQMYYLGEGEFASAMVAALEMTEQYIAEGVAEGHYAYDEATGEVLSPSDYGGYEEEGFSLSGMVVGLVLGCALGLGIGAIVRAVIKKSYARRYKPAAYDFDSKADLSLTANVSNITNKFVTTRRIPKNNSSSSGGSRSGSGVHRSSSGRSHGGGSRKF